MFNLLKPKTPTDALVLQHEEELKELRERFNRLQLNTFKLASKTGYTWKNNRWVKKGN